MSKRENKLTMPSLAQHFDAPDDYRGHFGWLCGYSADVAFLNDAAERFTRQTTAHRAHSGRIHLAMMLDPGNPTISLLDAPGIMHAAIKNAANKPFKLLHAKIALLGFRHQEDPSRWLLRLIVSTGNWTRQTLEGSLDLAWRIDLYSEDIHQKGDNVKPRCADIRAAQDLLTWIGEQFDFRLLDKVRETSDYSKQVSEWITQCAEKAGRAKPRLFDNRENSLLKQLPALINQHCTKLTRNYLAFGSGFYESTTNGSVVPSVPRKITSMLQAERLLTLRPELDLFVEPAACQAVAYSVQALNDQGFTVRPAGWPKDVFGGKCQRSLHAKFLFGANCSKNSNRCNSAWLYLGSGNLTKQGFANQMSTNDGNLEAGVVFAPENLFWETSKHIDPASVVTNALPIQWDTEFTPEENILQAGGDMPERDLQYVAAPVAWLTWIVQDDGRGILSPPPNVATECDVLFSNEQPCERNELGFVWQGQRPRQVMVRWKTDGDTEQRGLIPVIDQFGRIAATELPKLDIEAAWWQLANFPMPPEDDEPEPDNKDEYDPKKKGKHEKKDKYRHASYPVRQMMELIENIATKQTQVCKEDWLGWCNRLEQTLNQMRDSEVVEYFRNHLKLNPLSPLLAVPFRTCFAETTQTEQGKHYEEALQRVARTWGVTDLGAIGGAL